MNVTVNVSGSPFEEVKEKDDFYLFVTALVIFFALSVFLLTIVYKCLK